MEVVLDLWQSCEKRSAGPVSYKSSEAFFFFFFAQTYSLPLKLVLSHKTIKQVITAPLYRVNVGVQQGVIALICLLFVSWALNTILIWVKLQCTQEGALIIFNRSSKGMGGRPLTFAWIVRRKPQELSHDSLPEHTWLENRLHHHSKIVSGRGEKSHNCSS